ncbi:putative proline racemase, partial [Reticulomyxa filosa]
NKGNRIPTRLQEELRDRLNILKEEVFKVETENIQLRMNMSSDPLMQIPYEVTLCTVDMHTGGEPLRIVDGQMLRLPTEATLLQKRQYMMSYLDHYRKILLCEPRGHFDIGYSSMCGHAILALGRYAVDFGAYHCKPIDDPHFQGEQLVRIQVPCGIVHVRVEVKAGKSSGRIMSMEQYGRIEVDVGYGGTYYVIVPATRFNLDVKKAPLDDLINLGMTLKHFAEKNYKDLEFVYGTILTDGVDEGPTANVTIFADRQVIMKFFCLLIIFILKFVCLLYIKVDRCPTGSGVIARMAADYAKNRIKPGVKRDFIGRTGSVFTGEIKEELIYKEKRAIQVEVSGQSNYLGRSTYYLEKGDELGRGFFVR